MNEEAFLPQDVPCNECPAGIMHPRLITYFTWLGSELITVPQFPAWVCDVCGKREYDEKAIAWIQMLLNPNAGKPTPHHHRPVAPPRRSTGSTRSLSDS